MTRKSPNPTDWSFCILPRADTPRGEVHAFVNPTTDAGSWDQPAFPTLGKTVFAPLARLYPSVDEPYECCISVSKAECTREQLIATLAGLGMTRKPASFFGF